MLGALQANPELELFVADTLTPEWVAFAQRATAIIVATNEDPVAALAYVATAGVAAPIVIAARKKFDQDFADLRKAGAFACITMPVEDADLRRIVRELTKRAGTSRVDRTLRLLLDPIARVARFQNKSVHLTQRQFAVLHCLTSRGGRPVAAEEVMTYVWGQHASNEKSRQILDVYIFQVRNKLARIGLKGAISTIRGFGYAASQVAGD